MPTRVIYAKNSGILRRIITTDTDAELVGHQPLVGEEKIDHAQKDRSIRDCIADVEAVRGKPADDCDYAVVNSTSRRVRSRMAVDPELDSIPGCYFLADKRAWPGDVLTPDGVITRQVRGRVRTIDSIEAEHASIREAQGTIVADGADMTEEERRVALESARKQVEDNYDAATDAEIAARR